MVNFAQIAEGPVYISICIFSQKIHNIRQCALFMHFGTSHQFILNVQLL